MAAIMDRFIDRIEYAIQLGVIDLLDDSGVAVEPQIALTTGELARLYMILFPEEYPEDDPPAPHPTNAPPGTRRKVEDMAARLQSGFSLFDRRDADMTKAKSVYCQGRRNKCSSFKILEPEEAEC